MLMNAGISDIPHYLHADNDKLKIFTLAVTFW